MKSKQLTNFRSTGKDDAIRLTPPRLMSLEQAIAYIDDDEMVEVTPKTSACASAGSIRTSARSRAGRRKRRKRCLHPIWMQVCLQCLCKIP